MKQWKVIRPGKPPLYIDADYVVFDAGNLRFKRSCRYGYPEDLHVVGPRYWSEVIQCPAAPKTTTPSKAPWETASK